MPDHQVLTVVVGAMRIEAEEILSLELRSLDGSSLPPFQPGDHIDVHLGPKLIRQYSLCNGPQDQQTYTIAVKLEPASRGGSAHIHHNLRVGDKIDISAPRSNFTLSDHHGPSILLAAGIGITPIASMAKALATRPGEFAVHYFARSSGHVVFPKLWAEPQYCAQMRTGLTHYETQNGLKEIIRSANPTSHIYVCGPSAFMNNVLDAARTSGFPDAQVHSERFVAEPRVVTPPAGSTFTVKAERSGIAIEVGAEQTIVDALASCGVEIPISCEQGICGTCVTAVLAGVPDHKDEYLTDDEKAAEDQVCPCVSRSLTNELVLDV